MKRTKARRSRRQFSHKADVCVVGGAGHVGLPLALVLASKGMRVMIYDVNAPALGVIRKGIVPFMEKGAKPLLKEALRKNLLILSSEPAGMESAHTVIITIGTPVDEFMNPDTKVMRACMDRCLPHLRNGQLILLRSTVYPGTTDWIAKYLASKGRRVHVAFCPERVVQGYAIEELQKLPQITSGVTPAAASAAARLFRKIAPETVGLTPMEAEFAKLFSNAYRYIQFAIANQFYMITNAAGLDYNRIISGMKKNYARAAEIPRAGFAAGPCLFKDTMQLAAFSDNQFSLGHTAMIINEGLVLHLVGEIEKKHDLSKLTVGLLGMAFKANSDDIRSSLSYKLKKVLMYHAREVLTTDPHVTTDQDLLSLETVLRRSHLLILCVPHEAYRTIRIRRKPLIDIWGFLKK